MQLVQPSVPFGAVDDEPRVFQDTEMLGDRGTGDGKVFREPADRRRPGDQVREDRATRGVSQSVELSVSVSLH